MKDAKTRGLILKATDSRLRQDNWALIMDVCDHVRKDPEEYVDEVMECIESRLAQRDANVVLRSLQLVVALAENGGSLLRQRIASKKFTRVLGELVESPTTHLEVKRETVKILNQLTESFGHDPSLRYTGDLLSSLKRHHKYLFEKKRPKMAEPDDDLKKAMELSLKDYRDAMNSESGNKQPSSESDNYHAHEDRNEAKESYGAPNQPFQTPLMQTAYGINDSAVTQQPSIVKVQALYDLQANEPDELSFRKGDIIVVLEQAYRDWWKGMLRGHIGIFPMNYVTPFQEPSIATRAADIQQRTNLINQRAKINDLRNILRSRPGDASLLEDPNITANYNSTASLRPQVAQEAAKAAKERDELLAVHQILSNAEQTYHQLLQDALNATSDNYRSNPQSSSQGTG